MVQVLVLSIPYIILLKHFEYIIYMKQIIIDSKLRLNKDE